MSQLRADFIAGTGTVLVIGTVPPNMTAYIDQAVMSNPGTIGPGVTVVLTEARQGTIAGTVLAAGIPVTDSRPQYPAQSIVRSGCALFAIASSGSVLGQILYHYEYRRMAT